MKDGPKGRFPWLWMPLGRACWEPVEDRKKSSVPACEVGCSTPRRPVSRRADPAHPPSPEAMAGHGKPASHPDSRRRGRDSVHLDHFRRKQQVRRATRERKPRGDPVPVCGLGGSRTPHASTHRADIAAPFCLITMPTHRPTDPAELRAWRLHKLRNHAPSAAPRDAAMLLKLQHRRFLNSPTRCPRFLLNIRLDVYETGIYCIA